MIPQDGLGESWRNRFAVKTSAMVYTKKGYIMSKMQKWVTAVTFAFLFTNGLTAGAVGGVFTNTPAISVAEGATNTTIAAVIQVGGESVTNSGGYSNLSPTDLGTSKVSGPNPLNNFVYVAPSVVTTNLSDGFTYDVLLNNGTTHTVQQLITVQAVNDAPYILPAATNVISVTEDVTNSVINLAAWARDEEDALTTGAASTNLTYQITDQSGVTAGTLTLTNLAHGIVLFTPNPNVYGVTNSFTFKVTDKGGLSASATVNFAITAVNDAPDARDTVIFLEQQAGITNGFVDVSALVTDVDNTNFTYTVQSITPPLPAGDSTFPIVSGSSDTTGKVFFVAANTNTLVASTMVLRISDGLAYKDINVKLYYQPKNAPLIVTDSAHPMANPTISEGETTAFSITGRDMATNSVAGPSATLTTWGMSSINWLVIFGSVTNTYANENTAGVTTDGNESLLSGAFKLDSEKYSLTTPTTDFVVAAVLSDVVGNKTYKSWNVTVNAGVQQQVSVGESYNAVVGSFITNLAATVTPAASNVVLRWTLANTTSLQFKDAPAATSLTTTNSFPVLKAVKGLAKTAAILKVQALANGKYLASDIVTVKVGVSVPLHVKTLSILADGSQVEGVTNNVVTWSPVKDSYDVSDVITFTATPASDYAFVKYVNPAAVIVQSSTYQYTVVAGFDAETCIVKAFFKNASAAAKPTIINPGSLSATAGVAYNPLINFADFVTGDVDLGLANVTYALSGLPSGLSLSGSQIVGKPLSVGTYDLKLTVANAAGSSSASFALTVTALPSWLVGTYIGTVDAWGGLVANSGSATLTVTENGRVSGKVLVDAKTYTFKNGTFTAPALNATAYTLTINDGLFAGNNLTLTPPTTVAPVSPATAVDFTDSDADGVKDAYLVHTEKTVDSAISPFDGNYYTLSLGSGIDNNGANYGSGYLTITVKNGSAKVGGKLADGTSVSFATSLFVQQNVFGTDNDVLALLYAAPSKYLGGTFDGLIWFTTNAKGEKVIRLPITKVAGTTGTLNWNTNDPKATANYVRVVRTILDVQGGVFGSVSDLAGYYKSGLTVEGVVAPDLDVGKKVTDYNSDGKKTSMVSWETAGEALVSDTGAQISPNGLVVSSSLAFAAKADNPKKDAKTKEYVYGDSNGDGVDNTVQLKITLNKTGSSTGVFKGSFLTYFDYDSSYDATVDKAKQTHLSKRVSFEGVLVPVRYDADYSEGAGFYLWSRRVDIPPAGGWFDKDYIYYTNESYDFFLVD